MSIAEQISSAMDGYRDVWRSGLTLAKVTNINDDKNFNRVKCLPIGAEDQDETDWCYVMAPMGGNERGLCCFPQVEDLVVLAYLGDDPHRPIVLGSFWNSEQPPPYPIQEGKVQDYGLKTPKNIEILLHDEDNKQCVTLTMPSGTVLKLDDEAQKMTLQDKDGNNALVMDLQGGNIELKAKTKLTLSAGETTVTLESSGNITLKGNGTVKSEGASVEAKATGKLSLHGAAAEVKSDGTLDLQASGPTTVKGAILKLN